MFFIDYLILIIYFIIIFLVGVYFYRKNTSKEDYYVASRGLKPWHVGLSVVATDVGGGFSIGLGGLGYAIGISGSWLLFTGLIGAWLSAVLIIPRIKPLEKLHNFYTFPDFLRIKYGATFAFIAALVSGIGYMGFTGGQILAGAKLASSSIITAAPFGMDKTLFSIIAIAAVMLFYTSLGGMKAVVYTDTIQWIVLIVGLLFAAIPFGIYEAGGWSAIRAALPDSYFRLDSLDYGTIINWTFTVIPIWIIGMTLYQRIYSTNTVADAKKAWYIAGIFEYPIMAFLGVFLGMISRMFFPGIEPETGLPRLLKEVLPIGVKGIVIAAYFSAIMSTADSCLLASSGNFTHDIIERLLKRKLTDKQSVVLSQFVTFGIGIVAIIIAAGFDSVLEIILEAYSFMVATLTVPTVAAIFTEEPPKRAAFGAMIAGGLVAVGFTVFSLEPFGIGKSFWGITLSLIIFFIIKYYDKSIKKESNYAFDQN